MLMCRRRLLETKNVVSEPLCPIMGTGQVGVVVLRAILHCEHLWRLWLWQCMLCTVI